MYLKIFKCIFLLKILENKKKVIYLQNNAGGGECGWRVGQRARGS